MCASGPFPGRSEGRSWVKSKKYLKDQSGHWTRHGHQRRPFPFYGGEGEKMRPTIVENSSPSFWTNLLQALGVVRQEWWDALQVAFVLFCHFERGMHCQPNDIWVSFCRTGKMIKLCLKKIFFAASLWPNGSTFSTFLNCSEEILSAAS